LMHAMLYFVGSGHETYAALLLLRGLTSILRSREIGDSPLFLAMWATTPLPPSVPKPVQMIVRAHQVEAFRLAGIPNQYALSELVRLELELPSADSWALLQVVGLLQPTEMPRKLPLAFVHRVFGRLIEGWGTWRGPDNEPVPLPLEL